MSMRFIRVVVSLCCATLGAVLLFVTARNLRWGAPVKEVPRNTDGEMLTASTLELPGAPAWVVISSAVVGAIASGAAGWLLTELLLRHRMPALEGRPQSRRPPR